MFAVEDFETKEILHDERYVRFLVSINEAEDGNLLEDSFVEVGVHKCTNSEYQNLYEPHFLFKNKLEEYEANNSLMCMDDFDLNGNPLNRKLYGRNDDVSFRRIEILVMPCLSYRLLVEKNYSEFSASRE